MPLVNVDTLLTAAEEGGYAVGKFLWRAAERKVFCRAHKDEVVVQPFSVV